MLVCIYTYFQMTPHKEAMGAWTVSILLSLDNYYPKNFIIMRSFLAHCIIINKRRTKEGKFIGRFELYVNKSIPSYIFAHIFDLPT